MINPDEYTLVRGVPVRKSLINYYEQETGGKLVQDTEPALLMDLDSICRMVWERNGFRHTPQRTVQVHTDRYIHRDLPLSAEFTGLGVDINATGYKKMWFKARVIF
jgi:hypothetical protein